MFQISHQLKRHGSDAGLGFDLDDIFGFIGSDEYAGFAGNG